MPKTDNQIEAEDQGFYEIDGNLYFVDEKDDMFRLDFDVNKDQVYKSSVVSEPPEKKIENENDMTGDTEDITGKQIRENYYHETKETKLDGSTAMMEARISKCVEAGGSYEECSKKVKKEMKEKGSENTNTEDIEDVEDAQKYKNEEEEKEEEDEDKKEKKDTVDICPKELAILKEKAQKFDALESENVSLKGDMKSFQEDFLKLKKDMEEIIAERKEELEAKRQEKISKISADFDLPIEEIQEDSIEELDKLEKRFDMALKRDKGDEEEYSTEDMTKILSDMEQRGKALMEKYAHT